MKLYVVSGGIGKHVIFSGLIESLAKKHKSNISIMSAYPDIFKYHPKVDMSVNFDHPGFYDKYICKLNTKIFNSDPYYSNYIKGKTHISTEWAKLYNIKNVKNKDLTPDIYVDDFAVNEAQRFLKHHGKFIIIQFSGGQSPINIDPNKLHINRGQVRDYPRAEAQILVNKIREKYPNITILNYALPNEQTSNLENTISIQAPYLFYVALSQLSSGYICIDSSLQHFTANRHNNKHGIILWGSTGPKQLGYDKNINMSNSKEHNIRPLTHTLGDIFNEDGSQYKYEVNMSFNVEEILNSFKIVIEDNTLVESKIDNFVIDESRKEREIDLKPETSQLLMSLNAQSAGLQTQVQSLIKQIVEEQNLNGNFSLSTDGQKLIKS